MTNEMTQSITKREDQGLHHIYTQDEDDS